MPYSVAVDIGGTFTDLVAYDAAGKRVAYTKSPTTYGNFVEGIIDCFRKAGLAPSEASLVNHGTTLVINALIQRKGAKTALVTTRGFRDVLEIARGNRPDPFDLNYRRDAPLIARPLRFEVDERMGPDGKTIRALDEAGLASLAETLKRERIESVAIFFMNSYANPAHEEQAQAILEGLLPGVYVTHSTALTREWYEYERTSTVAANAYVGPQVATYVAKLDTELRGSDFGGALNMMGSNGGLLSVARTCRQPIALIESGPIGGCIGAAAYAQAIGHPNVIAFDMGGTTAKCALVEDGRFSIESTYYANGYVRGFPIKSPVIDIVEVGAGGGSIAWLDQQSRLHVGPQSAGSTPGPVCYRRGGTKPTVTDANLALGRINPEAFLGGELQLDVAAARAALGDLAQRLGYRGPTAPAALANGILALSTVTMAGAIKQVSVQHGLDPRDFVLYCYGGGGPLHAASLARELSIPTVVVPPEPGNFSAIGMLLADARVDLSKTFVGILAEGILADLDIACRALEAEAREVLVRDFGQSRIVFERFAEMRYVGQRHNIKVQISDARSFEALRKRFDADYKRRYGHADDKAEVEIQAVHLTASAVRTRPELAGLLRESRTTAPARTRAVVFSDADRPVETAVYQRTTLAPGFAAAGPVLIEEYGSTTLVWPGDTFTIGAFGEITIKIASQAT